MNKNTALVLLLFIVLNILSAFYQPFSKSFSVDEGQYILIAKKMLDGWVPYRDIVDNKPLGMYLSLIPAVLLGGKDMVKLRLYGALIASLTSFLIFLIGEKVKNKLAWPDRRFSIYLHGGISRVGRLFLDNRAHGKLICSCAFLHFIIQGKNLFRFFSDRGSGGHILLHKAELHFCFCPNNF